MILRDPPDHWIETPVPGDPTPLFAHFMPRHGYFQITGETDVGKTLVVLEIGHSLLTGQPLWGSLQPATGVTHITHIIGEHGETDVHEKWDLLGLEVPSKSYRLIYEPSLPLIQRGMLDPSARAQYEHWVKGSQVVIFDPLSAFILGSEIENDNVAMRALVNQINLIGRSCGAKAIATHHFGKPRFDPQGRKLPHENRYMGRGASGIEDATTVGWYMAESSRDNLQGFDLIPNKRKGDFPNRIFLTRDPDTLRHTLKFRSNTPKEMRQKRVKNLP